MLLTGCSAQADLPKEPSAQEKRNNFDACVIEWFGKNLASGSAEAQNYYRPNAEAACVTYLKQLQEIFFNIIYSKVILIYSTTKGFLPGGTVLP